MKSSNNDVTKLWRFIPFPPEYEIDSKKVTQLLHRFVLKSMRKFVSDKKRGELPRSFSPAIKGFSFFSSEQIAVSLLSS
jgi:hypothetical protein